MFHTQQVFQLWNYNFKSLIECPFHIRSDFLPCQDPLSLLDGLKLNVAMPKNNFSSDMEWTKKQPIFATFDKIVRVMSGRIDEAMDIYCSLIRDRKTKKPTIYSLNNQFFGVLPISPEPLFLA